MVGPPSKQQNCSVRNEASDTVACGGESSSPHAIVRSSRFASYPMVSLLAGAVQNVSFTL